VCVTKRKSERERERERQGGMASEEYRVTLTDLPTDPLLHILSYLDCKDLIRCSQVCHKLKDLYNNNSLWRRQTKVYWGLTECGSGVSWYDEFKGMYADLGQYMDMYMRVKNAWAHIKTYMHTHCPHIYDTIREGATEAQLDDLERKVGSELPRSMRCVYRIHDGQGALQEDSHGLFGGIENYNHRRFEKMLSINDIVLVWRHCTKMLMRPSQFLPLSFCHFSHTIQYLLVGDHSVNGLTPGQIFYPSESHARDMFISGSDYVDWFCQYAQDLMEDKFPLVEGSVLRFYHDPLSTATTQHLCISVATAFVPEMSRAGQHVHAYRVTLSMSESAPHRAACQLETRHWKIIDENGQEETVHGPGVIGEYPTIKPGTSWSYISCTHFKTLCGSMSGTYTMRNLTTGDTFEAVVPLFRMMTSQCVSVPRDFTKVVSHDVTKTLPPRNIK